MFEIYIDMNFCSAYYINEQRFYARAERKKNEELRKKLSRQWNFRTQAPTLRFADPRTNHRLSDAGLRALAAAHGAKPDESYASSIGCAARHRLRPVLWRAALAVLVLSETAPLLRSWAA